jgi:hypothetical protein
VIPALSISYFDPEQAKYQTASSPPLTLKVLRGADPGGPVTALSGLNRQNLIRQGSDINFIKLGAGDLDAKSDPIYRSAWFSLLALLSLSFNIGIYLYQREQAKQSQNVVLVRNRRARRTAQDRLKKAEKSDCGEPRVVYDTVSAALSGYITDKFNLPEIAVIGDTLERTLAEKSVNPETIGEILACMQECDFGRFVSASASPEKVRAITARIRRAIDAMEQIKP